MISISIKPDGFKHVYNWVVKRPVSTWHSKQLTWHSYCQPTNFSGAYTVNVWFM